MARRSVLRLVVVSVPVIVAVVVTAPNVIDAIQHNANDTFPADPLYCFLDKRLRSLRTVHCYERRIAKGGDNLGIREGKNWRRVYDNLIEMFPGLL